MKQASALVLGTNLFSMGTTAAILSFDLGLGLDLKHAQSIGGSMTLLLILFGIAAHLQARRGRLARGFVAAIGVPGPVYAGLSGPLLQVFGYHFATLGIHAFILYNLRRLEKSETP